MMKKPVFRGSAVAIVTPFTEDGVDFNKLTELCDWHIDQKTDASCRRNDRRSIDVRTRSNGRCPPFVKVSTTVSGYRRCPEQRHPTRSIEPEGRQAGRRRPAQRYPVLQQATQQGLYLHLSDRRCSICRSPVQRPHPPTSTSNPTPGARRTGPDQRRKECHIEQPARCPPVRRRTNPIPQDGLSCPAFYGDWVHLGDRHIVPRLTHEMVAA